MNKGLITIGASVLISSFAAYYIADTKSAKNESEALVDASYNGTSISPNQNYRTVNLSETDYPDFTYAAESCVDAVVYVEVTATASTPDYSSDPFFKFFFGDMQPGQRQQKSSGSGVIIREDGYIVTNNHVVSGASEIKVTLNNNTSFDAEVIGTDPATDIALIKVDAHDLPFVPIGDSDKLRLGEWVIAIGSPYGLRSTITAGIVSAKGRSMTHTGEFKIESFIQTDAAVNPGNSGGALVNKKGELVGINTMIYSQTGSFTGYSFAVPVNIVKRIVSDLIDFGSVKRAVLGISMSDIDEQTAKDNKLREGVVIQSVSPGGAADEAGIKAGDIIIRIDNSNVAGASSVQEIVNRYRPGDKANITVIRDKKEKIFKVTFQESSGKTGTASVDGTINFYGATIKDADEDVLKKIGAKAGVEIVSVGQGSMLKAGAKPGSIILYVNDKPVKSAAEVVEFASASKRSVFIEGVSAKGIPFYFAFGKDEQ